MTAYNPGTPQPPDIPAESQDDFEMNFEVLNNSFAVDHVAFGNTVVFATSANPCVCTSNAHGLITGNTINIVHFCSLIGDVLVPWSINGGPYTVTFIDINRFSINVDASTQPTYFGNSGAFSSPNFNYGFHKRTFFPNVQSLGPNTSPPLGSPYSAYYSKSQEYIDPIDTIKKFAAQLFYQNGVGSSNERQMTNLPVISSSNLNGSGIVTPWGLIINFGQIDVATTGSTFDLPIPFKSLFMTIVGTIYVRTAGKNAVTLVELTPSGLAQFTGTQTNKFSALTFLKIPVFYIAMGF